MGKIVRHVICFFIGHKWRDITIYHWRFSSNRGRAAAGRVCDRCYKHEYYDGD